MRMEYLVRAWGCRGVGDLLDLLILPPIVYSQSFIYNKRDPS